MILTARLTLNHEAYNQQAGALIMQGGIILVCCKINVHLRDQAALN